MKKIIFISVLVISTSQVEAQRLTSNSTPTQQPSLYLRNDPATSNQSGQQFGYIFSNMPHGIMFQSSTTGIDANTATGHMVLTNLGKVGIGTSNVDDKLHVKQVAGNAILKIENTGNGNASIIKFSRERSTAEDRVGGAIGLVSNTSNIWSQLFLNARSGGADVGVDGSGIQTPFLTIGDGFSNNVAVGIGTATPKNALDVVGTIRSTEVKVEATPWPDYVFEEDYDLRTLQETKEYISTNKHLPEIPSAKEMEANGVNIGDMNMRLLKKIEELTLHLIEQNERMEKMEKELQALKI